MRYPRTLSLALGASLLLTAGVACDEQPEPRPELAPAPPTPPARSPAAPAFLLDDVEISAAVRRELAQDEMIPQQGIEVRTLSGVVELTGEVPHLLAQERASRLASLVRGVRAVSNRIDVEPVKRSDAEIRTDISNALLYDRAAESFEVTPIVDGGAVRLTGEVDSWHERRLAAQIAKRIKGVVKVDNEVTFDPDAFRQDFEIEADVESRLRWDALVDDALIGVSVERGEVKLIGTVGSAAERARAQADAYVTGVSHVDISDLEVRWWADDDDLRRTAALSKSDDEVEQAIVDAALYDPRLLAANLDVEVDGGKAILRGEVDTQKAKRVAERLARNTVGVLDVDNELEVVPPTPLADAELEERIENGLASNPVTESYEIRVEVDKGDVTLSGTVDSYFERLEATDVALRQIAQGTVTDEIEVRHPSSLGVYYDVRLYPDYPDALKWPVYEPAGPVPDDEQLAKNVRDQLFWDPDVDSSRVKTSVEDGVVTLTGEVGTWLEEVSAQLNAWEAGARAVHSKLELH